MRCRPWRRSKAERLLAVERAACGPRIGGSWGSPLPSFTSGDSLTGRASMSRAVPSRPSFGGSDAAWWALGRDRDAQLALRVLSGEVGERGSGLLEAIGALDRHAQRTFLEELGEFLQGAALGGPTHVVPAGPLAGGPHRRGGPPAVGERSRVDLELLRGAGHRVEQGRHAAVLDLTGLGDHIAVARDHVVDPQVRQEPLVLREAGGDDVGT